MSGKENPEFVPEWDVFRDADGKPVTITWDQLRAIWHAVNVVEQVRRTEGHPSLWHICPGSPYPVGDCDINPQTSAELAKSRLLGRMLLNGKPPTKTRPPLEAGGPAWWLLPGGDPFAAVEGARHVPQAPQT